MNKITTSLAHSNIFSQHNWRVKIKTPFKDDFVPVLKNEWHRRTGVDGITESARFLILVSISSIPPRSLKNSFCFFDTKGSSIALYLQNNWKTKSGKENRDKKNHLHGIKSSQVWSQKLRLEECFTKQGEEMKPLGSRKREEREKYRTTEPTWQSFEHQPWGKIGTCFTWMHVELLSVLYGFSPAESFELFILFSVEKSWNHGSLTLVLVKSILPNRYLLRA